MKSNLPRAQYLSAETIALNRYNIIEDSNLSPGSIQETNPLSPPIYIMLYSSSVEGRHRPFKQRQDNPNSDGHKSENNVANIERNNPARRTVLCLVRPRTVVRTGEGDGANNGGKRRLMTNLRFSFRNRSFSWFLIIISRLRGGYFVFYRYLFVQSNIMRPTD